MWTHDSLVPLFLCFFKVRQGLDTLLFNLLVLGSLCDKMGRLWRRRSSDLYIIEITTNAPLPTGFSRDEEAQNQEVSQLQIGCMPSKPRSQNL